MDLLNDRFGPGFGLGFGFRVGLGVTEVTFAFDVVHGCRLLGGFDIFGPPVDGGQRT